MHSFYIDDSRRANSNVSILGGFVVDETDYGNLQRKYRVIKTRYGLTAADPAKWSPPHNAEFRRQRAIANQNAFRTDVVNLLGTSPIKIVAAAIEESGTYNRQRKTDYLCAALEFLAQRFERELSQTSPAGKMILDYPGREHELQMMKRYHGIRLNGSNYPGFSMQLPSLDETIYYAHDVTCDGIQLADFIVGAAGHSIDTHRYEYVRILRPKIRRFRGKVKGVGIVVYPSNSTLADGLIGVCEEQV